MGLLGMFKSKPAPAPYEPDEVRQVKSLLLAKHQGRQYDAEQLRRLRQQQELTPADEARMLKEVLASKTAAAAPTGFEDAGVVVQKARELEDLYLTWKDVLRYLMPDPVSGRANPLPHVRWHRHPDEMDEGEFTYVCSLLADLDAGKLKPGQVAHLGVHAAGGDSGFIPGIPVFNPVDPPITFEPDHWTFIRRRGQSQKDLERMRAAMLATVRDREERNGVVAPSRSMRSAAARW